MDAQSLFEILVREHADMLTAYIHSAVGRTALADDVFQETLLTAWRRLDVYDKQRPFGPWLRGIAARVVLSLRRQGAREIPSCGEETLEYLSDRFADLEHQPGDSFQDKLDILRDCVEHLPDQYRTPVRLHYADELGVSEMAQRLGVAVEAVKKRLQRARSRLLECVNRKLAAAGN